MIKIDENQNPQDEAGPDSFASESPTRHERPPVSPVSPVPSRRPFAHNHRDGCSCSACKKIQSRIARGLPSLEEEHDIKRAARAATKAAKKRARKERQKARERRIGTVVGVVAGQISAGVEPDLQKAGEIAGIDLSTGGGKEIVKKAQEGIHAALDRAGISDDRIAQVLAAGLEAKETRLVIEHGEVKDAVEFPDWHARHKFVTAILQTKGYLVKEDRSVPGSLIVINPTQVNLVPGHSPMCQCDACCQAWTERARKNIAELAKEQKAIIDQYADVVDVEAEPVAVTDEEPVESKPAESSKPMTDEERLASWEDD